MAMQGIQSPGAAAELTRLVAGDQKTGQLDELKRLEAEGKKDQVSGNVKQTGDSVKDAASNLGDAIKGDKR